ncbi:hypothetical protein LTR53_019505, partial [Teratosphaeriaceae sp. CCFEE 6253]
KGKRSDDPLPLDQQVRIPPHSKKYPVPEYPKSEKSKGWHGDAAELRIERTKSRIAQLKPGQKETRLRQYVAEPDEEYENFLERANTQKMFIINREQAAEMDCHAGHEDCPSEVLKIAGSKGDIYT